MAGGALGEPCQDVVIALKRLKNEGWKIIVHTALSADYLHAAGVPLDEINRTLTMKTKATSWLPRSIGTIRHFHTPALP